MQDKTVKYNIIQDSTTQADTARGKQRQHKTAQDNIIQYRTI